MKNFRVLTVAVSVLLMLMMAQSVAAQGKRISRMEYEGYYVDLNYDDNDRVVSAYDSEFGMQHFSYDDDNAYSEGMTTEIFTFTGDGRLSGLQDEDIQFSFSWAGDAITLFQEFDEDGLDTECALTYYDRECNVPALSHALSITAAIFAEPEELGLAYSCYAVKDYLGTPVRKLVKTAHMTEYSSEGDDHTIYDVTYDYEFDAEGYVTEVKMHIEQEDWNGGSSRTYVKDKPMRIYWEPTTGVEGIADSHKVDEAIYTLSGQKVARTSADALKRGAYILGGRKIIMR